MMEEKRRGRSKGPLLIFLILLIAVGLSAAFSTRLSKEAGVFTPTKTAIAVNQAAGVPIFINTAGATINAAEVYLHYDPSLVKVESVSSQDSIFQILISGEPKFSNEKGEISFAGGIPTPGFKGKGQIGLINVIVLKPGQAQFTVDTKTRILSNDGKGSAIRLNLQPIVFSAQ